MVKVINSYTHNHTSFSKQHRDQFKCSPKCAMMLFVSMQKEAIFRVGNLSLFCWWHCFLIGWEGIWLWSGPEKSWVFVWYHAVIKESKPRFACFSDTFHFARIGTTGVFITTRRRRWWYCWSFFNDYHRRRNWQFFFQWFIFRRLFVTLVLSTMRILIGDQAKVKIVQFWIA